MNTDDLIAQMKADDNEGATHLKPVRYAHLRGIQPQKVYYWIRAGKIDYDYCVGGCGERVIEVAEADKLLRPKSSPEEDADA
jgi:hypothetical protein